MNKIVYSYDEKNYFTKKLVLDDTDLSPSGRWNVPARTTEIEPPAKKDGLKIKWNGAAWEYEEEKKEKPQPEPTFEELQQRKLAEINAWTANKITGGFVSSASGEPVTYDSDKETQLTVSSDLNTIKSAPEAFAENYPTGYPMRGYPQGTDTTNPANKVIYYLSTEQLVQWNVDIGLHRGACKRAGWEKQAQVEKATTKEELDDIVLD